MKKKVIALLLSVSMVASLMPAMAMAAEPEETDQTLHYVALGDSIAAGFGLAEDAGTASLSTDPGLLLHTVDEEGNEDEIPTAGHDLVPVKGAYSYVYYENYLMPLAEEAGYDVEFANLSATAFRASDVNTTITTDTQDPWTLAPIASMIMENYVATGKSAVYTNYHEIYEEYLKDADLVSIQLGGNDIVMNILLDMQSQDNPILTGIAGGIMLTLFGMEPEDTLAVIMAEIQSGEMSFSDITVEDVAEAVEYLSSTHIEELGAESESMAVSNLAAVLESVQNIGQDDLDIALLNMYNPYGNSLSYSGSDNAYGVVVTQIMQMAVEQAYQDAGQTTTTTDVVNQAEKDANISEYEAESIADDLEDREESLSSLMDTLDQAAQTLGLEDGNALLNTSDEEIARLLEDITSISPEEAEQLEEQIALAKSSVETLLDEISSEISYAIQYLLVGRTINGNIESFNAEVKKLADADESIAYVDVYDIPNESNLDPHPDAAGHEAIADKMGDQLDSLVKTKLGISTVKGIYHSPITATCTSTGTVEYWEDPDTGAKLDADGNVIDDITTPIDPCNHVGGYEIRNLKKATCEKDGYTGDLYCKGCNNMTLAGFCIPALGHNFYYQDNGDGTHSLLCTRCDYSETEEHTYEDGICIICKACEEIAVSSVTLDQDEMTLTENDTATLEATVAPSDASDPTVVWTSSDEDVATVDDGIVTAISAGTATITATAGDESATCEVTVTHNIGDLHEAVAATCISEGNVEYYDCTECDAMLDADGNEIEDITTPIDSDNHVGETEIRDAADATCTEDGYTGDTYCESCDAVLENGEDIPALGHDYVDGECTRCGEIDPSLDQLIKLSDGNWYYVKDGEIQTSFTGFMENEYGIWYVKSGKVDFSANSVVKGTYNGKIKWGNVKNGKLQQAETVAKNDYGWWYIGSDGFVDFTANTIAKNQNGWWAVVNGQVDFSNNGIATNKNGTYKISNGKVTFKDNGVIKVGSNWFYLVNSKVTAGPSVQKNSAGWWYIDKNGRVDFSFTGIASNEYGSWYCVNGKVNFGFSGKVRINGKAYTIQKGRVVNANINGLK